MPWRCSRWTRHLPWAHDEHTVVPEENLRLEDRLADRTFLLGDEPTEVDVRLFTTLVRFDAVHHGHFTCNRTELTEMPNLWRHAKALHARPGWVDTVDFDHIKRHYYVTHSSVNPTGIVSMGPDLSVWPPVARGAAPLR